MARRITTPRVTSAPRVRAPRIRAPRGAAASPGCGASSSEAPRWMATAAFVVLALLALALAVRLMLHWGDAAGGALAPEGFEAPRARLVYVHMHGCGWCERFNPAWDAFVRSRGPALTRAGVAPEKLEASEPGAKALAVRSFPTVLLLVSEGGRRVEFDGERTDEGLVAFLAANGFALGRGGTEPFAPRRVDSTPDYVKEARQQAGESGMSEQEEEALKRSAGGIKGSSPMGGPAKPPGK